MYNHYIQADMIKCTQIHAETHLQQVVKAVDEQDQQGSKDLQ